MVFVVGLLLILLVVGYISFPLFQGVLPHEQTVNEKQLKKIEDEIERDIRAFRK